mgnify:CR=1 FL=1
MSGSERFHVVPIGVIHSPFAEPKGTPIQPSYAREAEGTVEVYLPYREALADLEPFDRMWLLYWFDRAGPFRPQVVPFRDVVSRGLFSTRAPCRPNRIGLSSVRLLSMDIENGILRIGDVDILDGTPLLDIKPYVPTFDSYPSSAAGWLDGQGSPREQADDRFG